MSIIHTKAIALELKRRIKLIWAKLYDYVKGQVGQNTEVGQRYGRAG